MTEERFKEVFRNWAKNYPETLEQKFAISAAAVKLGYIKQQTAFLTILKLANKYPIQFDHSENGVPVFSIELNNLPSLFTATELAFSVEPDITIEINKLKMSLKLFEQIIINMQNFKIIGFAFKGESFNDCLKQLWAIRLGNCTEQECKEFIESFYTKKKKLYNSFQIDALTSILLMFKDSVETTVAFLEKEIDIIHDKLYVRISSDYIAINNLRLNEISQLVEILNKTL